MSQRKTKHAFNVKGEVINAESGKSLHSAGVMNDFSMRHRIAEQIGDLVGAFAEEAFGIDGKPAPRTAKDVLVV